MSPHAEGEQLMAGSGKPKKEKASYAVTMRAKLKNAFRFGFTGTPIDRTMHNTHRDFGFIEDGQNVRYLSYYGIKRAIMDGATLPVHYVRAMVPFEVDEKPLNVSYEQMCEEMELEDEEAKDFVQKKRAQWKELATHPDRVEIVIDKVLDHFLEYPDPNGFKAQLVAVDRKACAVYKGKLDEKLKARGMPTEWCDVIISEAQNSEPDVAKYEYPKTKQEELIDHFKLTPREWEAWNREQHGDDSEKWRPPLKILIVCDRLLTGFDAPVEQVMYLDKPLRDHNLLQAIARTNRPLPSMKKETGVVVDYFGNFENLERALNFDESVREESLIDWDALRRAIPGEVAGCMEFFSGIAIEDTRDSLLAAVRRLREPEAAKRFEQNFKSLERLWEAVSPDACLYPHGAQYNWLCSIYIAWRRRLRGTQATYGELAAKTRKLIQENTKFMKIAEELPVFKIDENYTNRLDDLPSASDKAAALEAALAAELSEEEGGFTYRMLGGRLQKLKERKDASDEATAKRLWELQEIAAEVARIKQEPQRLGLTRPGEYELFSVLREYAKTDDEKLLAESARRMVAHLRENQVLPSGWSNSLGGRKRVEESLLAESWNEEYAALGFDPADPNPPFLAAAVEDLAKADA
jgi:type I restriction enzyme R subunit